MYSRITIGTGCFFEIDVENVHQVGVGVFVSWCDATPSPDPDDPQAYRLVENGCPASRAVHIEPVPSPDRFRFRSQSFHFSGDVNNHNQVYVHCSVTLCPARTCYKGSNCHSNGFDIFTSTTTIKETTLTSFATTPRSSTTTSTTSNKSPIKTSKTTSRTSTEAPNITSTPSKPTTKTSSSTKTTTSKTKTSTKTSTTPKTTKTSTTKSTSTTRKSTSTTRKSTLSTRTTRPTAAIRAATRNSSRRKKRNSRTALSSDGQRKITKLSKELNSSKVIILTIGPYVVITR
ncbi:hypothetical protein RRG08_038593 [Elysia crispata]|uniref:ZP domain-containing protein n=1 Tax=Elysia crispata TaxID=231223 RepID=A0AAE1ASF9_9GAST|nr:hypothetical protein RRG08_038593 [Elysia crispata]